MKIYLNINKLLVIYKTEVNNYIVNTKKVYICIYINWMEKLTYTVALQDKLCRVALHSYILHQL